jgi:chaperone LolA
MRHMLNTCKSLLCVLALTSSPLYAKALSVAELRQIQSTMKAYDSLTVDFVQSRYSDVRKKSSRREGRAQFAKPNLFRWMLETPKREYKIFDGKSFYDFDPETNTAKRYATSGEQSHELNQMIDLILNFDSLLKRYDVVTAEAVGDLIKIHLKPKAAGDVSGIELHFAQKEQFVSFLKMELRNKNALTHEFKNPSHAAIPETAFALPKGVKASDNN